MTDITRSLFSRHAVGDALYRVPERGPFSSQAAQIERNTSQYSHMCATVLHYYVKGELSAGLERAGFPISGDMLHIIKLAKEHDSATQHDIDIMTRKK